MKIQVKVDEKKVKKRKSYSNRKASIKSKTAKKLLDIMEQKQTNLCVSADVTTADELIQLAEAVT